MKALCMGGLEICLQKYRYHDDLRVAKKQKHMLHLTKQKVFNFYNLLNKLNVYLELSVKGEVDVSTIQNLDREQ